MTEQPKEYIITEHLIKSWREGCPRYDSDVHPQDKCVGCQYDNKTRHACDFDDNEVEKRFRTRPVSTPPVPDSKHLIEMAKTEWKNREERRGIHNEQDWCCGWMAGFLYVDKPDWIKAQMQAAREKVLDEIDTWLDSWLECCSLSGTEAMRVCDFFGSLRKHKEQP
jgi:hypothetical protein